jgi:integrase
MNTKIEKKQTSVESLAKMADIFESCSVTESTKRAYESDWQAFWRFCRDHDLLDLPADPETVAIHLTDMADSGLSVSTIQRRSISISAIHRAAGFESPAKTDRVRRVIKGIKKRLGTAPRQAKALSWPDIRRMVQHCDTSIIGVRDSAILLLGWTSALRRSELVALDIGDLEFVEQGLILTIRRSKTDQMGEGAKIGIPSISNDAYCPVFAVQRWIARAKSRSPSNPLFLKIGASGRNEWFREPEGRLSDRMIPLIIKRYAKFSGMDPNLYSAHSLRRGLATDAGAAGVPERVISRHTRHRSIAVLRNYIEDGTIWQENPLPIIYGRENKIISTVM